jgi:uncharacterized protein
MRKKVSKYLYCLELHPDIRLAYSALFTNLVSLRGTEYDSVQMAFEGRFDCNQLPIEQQEDFARLGFLLDEDVNELNVIRETRRLSRDDISPTITVLPTLGCNFVCEYCFERVRSGSMSLAVQDALIRFVNCSLLPNAKSLSINWYGGEPLLVLPIIESLAQELKKVCSEHDLPPPTQQIITNGFLLGPATVQRLKAAGIDSAQVTLDGTAEMHDKQRHLRDGTGTFATILENLKLVKNSITLNIRINVSRLNHENVLDLLRLLRDEGIAPPALPYIASVEEFNCECEPTSEEIFTPEQFAAFREELIESCVREKIVLVSNDRPRLVASGYCVVDNPRGFVVDPNGHLYKCWAQVGGAVSEPSAKLLQPETWKDIKPTPLEMRDALEDTDCCDCRILPVCMGGCPVLMQQYRMRGTKRCPSLRFCFPQELRRMFLSSDSGPGGEPGSDTTGATQSGDNGISRGDTPTIPAIRACDSFACLSVKGGVRLDHWGGAKLGQLSV